MASHTVGCKARHAGTNANMSMSLDDERPLSGMMDVDSSVSGLVSVEGVAVGRTDVDLSVSG